MAEETYEERIARYQKAAPRAGGGNYIKGAGLFLLKITGHKKFWGMNETFTKRDKERFVVEFEVVASSLPDHKVGSSVSWLLKDPSDNFGDVKAFAVAAVGQNPKALPPDGEAQRQATLLGFVLFGEAEAAELLKVDPNVFIGRHVKCETVLKKTKANTDFTKHLWSPVEAPKTTSAT